MFRLVTFGGLALVDDGGTTVATPRRRLALLALLAAAGQRGLTRDRLVLQLSPEKTPDKARHSLEQLVYELRRQVDDALFLGTDPLQLNPDVMASDLSEFEDACVRGAFADAAARYRGPFLDGFYLDDSEEFERWVDAERARLAKRCTDALEQMARRFAEQGDLAAAVASWRRLVTLNPLSARATLALMTALADAGERAEAIRLGRAYQVLIRHELGAEPAAGVSSLLQRLLHQTGPSDRPPPPASDKAAAGSPPSAPLPTVAGTLVAGPRAPDLQTALADHYAVEREIGRGGMSVVFFARDLKHDRAVAIKVLRPQIAAAIGTDRFLREIQIAARLQHPHLLPLYDSGEVEGWPYYVMPFVDGESLRDRLNREKQLPIAEAIRIAREVASALGYAHSQGVVHRDIKPENILLSAGHAVVADFGIATAITAAGGEKLTLTGITLGTPHYMSPEHDLGTIAPSGQRDLYALGCVLYEMLAGNPPFTGATPQSILARHAADPVPSLRTVRDSVPPGIEWAITKAMAKVPADRFATAGEFTDALLHPENAPLPYPRRRRPVPTSVAVAAGLVALVALVMLNVGNVQDRLLGRPIEAAIRSLAVLPVDNLTGDTAQVYLASGMTDEFITDLAQISALRVIGRTSVMRYQGSQQPKVEIAGALHVDGVLSASLQRAGDTVHLTAQLTSATTGLTLWAKSYDGDVRDVLRLQGEISRSVAAAIRIRLTSAERDQLARQQQVDPAVYAAYVRGRYFWNKRTAPDFQTAIGYFMQALDGDPAYAPAYSGLGDTYLQMGYASLKAPAELFPKAREAAQRALQLDSTLAEPHATLGFYNLYYAWNWGEAEREFGRALAINPSYATAHEWYGLYLTAMGRFEEARGEERRAMSLDPLSVPIAATVGWVFHYSGMQDSAARQLHEAIAMDSSQPVAHLYLGRVFQAEKKYDSAIAMYGKAGRLLRWIPNVAGVGYVYGILGKKDDARRILDTLLVRARSEYVTAYAVALLYTALGDKDRAFEWLNTAVAERTHWLVWLERDTRWGPIRGDPRFKAIERRVGLPAGSS